MSLNLYLNSLIALIAVLMVCALFEKGAPQMPMHCGHVPVLVCTISILWNFHTNPYQSGEKQVETDGRYFCDKLCQAAGTRKTKNSENQKPRLLQILAANQTKTNLKTVTTQTHNRTNSPLLRAPRTGPQSGPRIAGLSPPLSIHPMKQQ